VDWQSSPNFCWNTRVNKRLGHLQPWICIVVEPIWDASGPVRSYWLQARIVHGSIDQLGHELLLIHLKTSPLSRRPEWFDNTRVKGLYLTEIPTLKHRWEYLPTWEQTVALRLLTDTNSQSVDFKNRCRSEVKALARQGSTRHHQGTQGSVKHLQQPFGLRVYATTIQINFPWTLCEYLAYSFLPEDITSKFYLGRWLFRRKLWDSLASVSSLCQGIRPNTWFVLINRRRANQRHRNSQWLRVFQNLRPEAIANFCSDKKQVLFSSLLSEELIDYNVTCCQRLVWRHLFNFDWDG
jgi:hypothetical protein